MCMHARLETTAADAKKTYKDVSLSTTMYELLEYTTDYILHMCAERVSVYTHYTVLNE